MGVSKDSHGHWLMTILMVGGLTKAAKTRPLIHGVMWNGNFASVLFSEGCLSVNRYKGVSQCLFISSGH